MPRPTVINAKRQPIPPLNLEELKFWLRIMEDHALFVKAGLPLDNPALINQADTFHQELAALCAQAEKVQSERKFAEVVTDAQSVIEDLYRFLRRILHLVLTCQIVGGNFALFLDHLSREAEYVVRLLRKLGTGLPPYQVSAAREAAFWLRLMADHGEFIYHRLDPSERTLLDTAADFSHEFDELYLQGRDFVSMLRGEPDEIPSFRRFLQDVRVSTMRLRDFERAAEALISDCKLVGLIPAVLADHIRRETDHFLLVLTLLEKSTYVPVDEAGDMEEPEAAVSCVPIVDIPESAGVEAVVEEAFVSAETVKETPDEYCDEEEDDDQPPEPLLPPPPPPVETKTPKYKWSGKWPRPLGSMSD